MEPALLILPQVTQMLAALLAGLLCALAFHLYQREYARRRRFMPRARRAAADGLFSLGVIFLLLLFWFGLTDGSLRAAVFLWLSAGAAAFHFLLRPLLSRWRLPRRQQKRPAPNRAGRKKPRISGEVLIDKAARRYLLLRQPAARRLSAVKARILSRLKPPREDAPEEKEKK